jgi:hypothetical protein
MKTKDETFRILSQRPFNETEKALWREIRRNKKILECEEKMIKFLSKYGWTIEEFSDRMVTK